MTDWQLPPDLDRALGPEAPEEGHRTRERPRGRGPWAWFLLVATVGVGGYLAGRAELGGLADWEAHLGALPEVLARFASTDGADGPDSDAGSETGAEPETGTGGEAAAAMDYVQGDGQEAEPGAMLPQPFSVVVRDAEDRPVEGVEVRFEVLAGGGNPSPSSATTDASGRASTFWTLGPQPGFQRLAARSPTIETIVTFTAIAREGAGAGLLAGPADPAEVEDRAGVEDRVDGVEDRVDGAADPSSVVVEAAPEDDVEAEPLPLPPPEGASSASAPRPTPPPSVRVAEMPLAVGGATVCALTGSSVTCRGSDDRGQRVVRSALGSRAVIGGLFHLCALDDAGRASCWGANDGGQLGDGTRTDRNAPTPVDSGLRFSELTAGAEHTCGLTASGTVACWGRNLNGQLGDGSRTDRSTPVSVQHLSFTSVVAGWNHTCAVAADGAAYCWGLNRDGQLGDGTTLDRLVPERAASSVEALAAGSSHTCAIVGDEVRCWGGNRFGQLGDGTTEARSLPSPVEDLPGAPRAIVAGAAHTCALLFDGAAYCWGQNLHGQLGDGSTTSSNAPVPVSGDLRFEAIHAGGAVTCGVTGAGAQYCWGLNQSGQLGDGTLTNRSVPTRVAG